MLRRAAAVIAVLIFGGIAYLTLAPVPIEPVAWQAPPAPGYAGAHALKYAPCEPAALSHW